MIKLQQRVYYIEIIAMYKISFYVPETHLEKLKEALFQSGAGKIGNYERCSWQVKGEGQFFSKAGSKPFLGKELQLERVEEYLVEMICHDEFIHCVLATLKSLHPYETPVYSVVKLEKL